MRIGMRVIPPQAHGITWERFLDLRWRVMAAVARGAVCPVTGDACLWEANHEWRSCKGGI